MSTREEEITIKEIITIYKCDFCGKETEEEMKKCIICGQHMCNKDTHHYRTPLYFKSAYCTRCWFVGEKFRKEEDEENERHKKTRSDIQRRWKEVSIK